MRVDGEDVRDLTLKSLRSHIGVVQQDVYLFSGTVYDNIAYGRPGASREEVEEAARWREPTSLSRSSPRAMTPMWESGA